MKLTTALVLFALLGTAPFQCASREPAHRIEDTPGEALWALSERFRREGNEEARRMTLTQLVEQYPNSREAERARLALSGRDVAPDPPEEPDPAPRGDAREANNAEPEPAITPSEEAAGS